MSYAAVIARRRRRGTIVITDFTPAELVWQDGPPSLASIGATTYSRAVARNAAHQILPQANQPTITYSSLATGVATVNSSGVVTAVSNGTATIQAASAGLTTISQTATVSQVAASITVSPTTFSITDAGSQQLTATVKDANANTISGASVSWASDAPSTATVNSSGLVTGQGPGTVHITASSGGFSATSTGTISHVTYTLTVTPNPVSGTTGSTVQLTVMEDTGSGPVDVTADAGTSYSIANTAVATVDAPTVGTLSPTSITQGQSNVAFTLSGCTNLRASDTMTLPSGVTMSSYTVTGGGTGATFNLSATAGATPGAGTLSVSNTGHGTSGTVALTVNSSTPAGTPQTTFYLRATSATTAPAATTSATLPLAHANGTGAWRNLSTSHGTGASNTFVQSTLGAPQSLWWGGWVSPALSAQTLPTGTYTLKVGLYSENANGGYYSAPVLTVYRPGTSSVVGRLYDSSTGIGNPCALNNSTSAAGRVLTFTGTGFAVQSGDLLILEYYAVQTSGSNAFIHLDYDGITAITEGGDTSNGMAELDFPASIYFGG